MTTGENRICFQVSSEGEVLFRPEMTIQSTSDEMGQILIDIGHAIAKDIETMLRARLDQQKGG